MKHARVPLKPPTHKQICFFKRHDLVLPPTREVCSNLIGYLINGNGAGPRTFGGRRNYLRHAWNRYVGKSAQYMDVTDEVLIETTTKYLIARTRGEIAATEAIYGQTGLRPVHAVIDDRAGALMVVDIDRLRFAHNET